MVLLARFIIILLQGGWSAPTKDKHNKRIKCVSQTLVPNGQPVLASLVLQAKMKSLTIAADHSYYISVILLFLLLLLLLFWLSEDFLLGAIRVTYFWAGWLGLDLH